MYIKLKGADIEDGYYKFTKIEMIDERDGKYHIIFDDKSKPPLRSKTETCCEGFKINTLPELQ